MLGKPSRRGDRGPGPWGHTAVGTAEERTRPRLGSPWGRHAEPVLEELVAQRAAASRCVRARKHQTHFLEPENIFFKFTSLLSVVL